MFVSVSLAGRPGGYKHLFYLCSSFRRWRIQSWKLLLCVCEGSIDKGVILFQVKFPDHHLVFFPTKTDAQFTKIKIRIKFNFSLRQESMYWKIGICNQGISSVLATKWAPVKYQKPMLSS